jgi:hypothetical protein
MDNPPYYPDFVRADFWPFPALNNVTKVKFFSNVEDIKLVVKN